MILLKKKFVKLALISGKPICLSSQLLKPTLMNCLYSTRIIFKIRCIKMYNEVFNISV